MTSSYKAVLDGDINPGRVFTHSYSLDEVDQAYKDVDERKTPSRP